MTLLALVLVMCAALAHAAWNIVAHGSSNSGLPFLWWGALFSVLIWVGAVPFTGGIGSISLGGFLWGIAVSGVLHVGYMLVLQRGYAKGELSTVYATARGTGPTLTVLFAVLALGEKPGLLALGGVALVIGGVVAFGLIGRGSRGAANAATGTAVAKRGLDPALVYGLLTGVAIAIYTVWDAHYVSGLGAAPVAFMVGCSFAEVVLFGFGLLLDRGRRGHRTSIRHKLGSELRNNWPRLLTFGVLSPLSYILVLTAVTMAPMSLVAPMREVSVVLIGLYGVWRFRESRPMLRIVAACVVVAGVCLIGFAGS